MTGQPPRAPRLIAVRVDRASAGPAVRRIWAAGDAVLLLDPDGPEAHRAELLAALRPDALLDLVEPDDPSDPGGPSGPSGPSLRRGREQPLDGPLPTAAGTAVVVATSGSTGTPKGVVLTHDALTASTRASLVRLGARAGDRWALLLPTHHVAGLQVWLRAWAAGGDPICLDHPTALTDSGATFVSLVPTQLARWLDDLDAGGPRPGGDPVADHRPGGDPVADHRPGDDPVADHRPGGISTPPTVLLGGAAASAGLLERAADAGLRVITSYGMSETGGGCVYDGRPLDGVEVALDGGRIGLRGPMLASAYRGQIVPLTDPQGWFWTSDLGAIDATGRLTVLGRADDVIISGGENVPLPAVRATLATHPSVAEVAVIGRPDARWGQVVVALVVPVPGAIPTLEALRSHVRATHPTAYAPRRLAIVDALPRDAMGKLPRSRLEVLAERAAPA